MDPVVIGALIAGGAGTGGVLLTIGGSLLTEKIRAGREKETRLHDARQDLYSRFVSNADRLANWIYALRAYPDYAPEEVDEATGPIDLDEWAKAQSHLEAEISLIGHPDVVNAAKELTYTAYEWAVFRVEHQESGMLHAPAIEDDEDPDDPDARAYADKSRELQDAEAQLRDLYRDANGKCIDAMRKDLGTPALGGSKPSFAALR